MRENIHFLSHGLKCAAWLYQPERQGKAPIIVMAHGLAAVKEMRLDAYAEKFAEAGFACLVFDYRYFGESEGEPRQLLDIKKQHQDWLAAVEFAKQLPNVDTKKVILWGSSLSGGHVIQVAAQAKNIAAVVSQVPHLDGFASLRMNSIDKMLKLSLHGGYDFVRGVLGLSPHYVLSSSEPNQLALMNAAGESDGYLHLVPDGQNFDRRVAARFALDIGMYSPVKYLAKLKKCKIPVLMQVAMNDVTTPAKPAIKAARKYKNIELHQYNTGHFQPYIEPLFSQVVADQLTFLRMHV